MAPVRPIVVFLGSILATCFYVEASSIFPCGNMNDPQSLANRLFTKCFSKDELEYLQRQPQFIEAARKFITAEDALNAVDVGTRLIRESWRKSASDAIRRIQPDTNAERSNNEGI
jgi:hypothetical protein